jgi:hypothetical protein
LTTVLLIYEFELKCPFLLSQHHTKGDLKVKFKIAFPDLNAAEREQIGSILRNSSSHQPSANGTKFPRK